MASGSTRTRRQVLAVTRENTIAKRLAADRLPGFLRRGTVGVKTRLAYSSAWLAFTKWCDRRDFHITPLAALATSMERYFEFKAKNFQTAAVGRNVLYGYLKLVSTSPKSDRVALSSPLEALAGWPRIVKEGERDPIPEMILFEIA